MKLYQGGTIEYSFLKEIRKKWNPYWKKSECKVYTNDYVITTDLEAIDLKNNQMISYHVNVVDGVLYETITKGNYIVLRTKIENAQEIAIEIAKKFGLLYYKEFENDKIEELMDKFMIKKMKHYHYDLSSRRVSTDMLNYDIKIDIDGSSIYVIKDMDNRKIKSEEDLKIIQKEMEKSNSFIQEFDTNLEKQNLRLIVGG